MLPKYMKKKNDSIIFDGDGTLKIYIPEKQFELNIAKPIGDFYSILGVVPYAIQDSKGKMSKLHKINCPTRFVCKPNNLEYLKGVRLIKESNPTDYRVLNFIKGNPVIVSTKVPQDVVNVEQLINLFIITGNIPNTIPYDQLQFYIVNNMLMNGNNYGLNLQEWGVIISEICRSSKDLSTPYRLSKSKDLRDYQSISVKDISKMSSAFTAIQSENFDDSIVHAMMANKDSTSPLEKILTNGF